jgi:hypothetical protein
VIGTRQAWSGGFVAPSPVARRRARPPQGSDRTRTYSVPVTAPAAALTGDDSARRGCGAQATGRELHLNLQPLGPGKDEDDPEDKNGEEPLPDLLARLVQTGPSFVAPVRLQNSLTSCGLFGAEAPWGFRHCYLQCFRNELGRRAQDFV